MIFKKNNIDQPLFFIYIKNFISFILFIFIKSLALKSKTDNPKNILFVNTGQIGDLIISSLVLVNEDKFENGKEMFLLIKKKYYDLFAHYNGRVKIIYWDYPLYRFSMLYRIKFLKELQKLNLEYAINITSARGPNNDEITIVSGALKKMCFKSNQKHMRRIFANYYDKHYDRILDFKNKTEFEKQSELLELLTKKEINRRAKYFLSNEIIAEVESKIDSIRTVQRDKLIVINPMSDIEEKDWSAKNYYELNNLFLNDNYLIIYQGSRNQRNKIEKIIPKAKNIINIAGEFTLTQSAALIQLADLFICNDSGFTHIAKALGKPLIGIIGCGSHGIFFPYNEKKIN